MDSRLHRGVVALAARESGLGRVLKDAPVRMALLYPSPYRVAMSSLGFLQIHRLANARQGTRCERAVLPEAEQIEVFQRTRTPLLAIESGSPVSEFDLIGVSVAYELEIAGVAAALELAGIAPLASDRSSSDPLVVLGGPLTFSNPLPAAPFADVVLLGEADETIGILLGMIEERPEAARGDAAARQAFLESLVGRPGFYVPSLQGELLPPVGQAPDEMLPAYSEIQTPDTELHDMLLIEPERGCHRGCTFCVMRRSTNGGMRLVDPERVVSLAAREGVTRVGLVGAAVTDHPGIKTILRELVDVHRKNVGISSLRADRLDEELVGLLARGGYRSMTVALDAPSVKLRDAIEKNLKDRHVERATQLARDQGMKHLKIYVIAGLPEETDEDLDELVALALKLGKTLPVVLAVSPFVPKFQTPLAQAPFCGEAEAARKLARLRAKLGGRATIRGPSAREAYVEYRLAQGGHAHARAAMAAARAGASLGAWKRALADLPERFVPPNIELLTPAPTLRRRWQTKLEASAGLR